MKTLYFKHFCRIFTALVVVLFCQQSIAASAPSSLTKPLVTPGDTVYKQKPGKLRRPKKSNKDKDADEDGVDANILARGHQEYMQQRDPKLKRVPLERLLVARAKRDQLLANIKARPKKVNTPGNVIKSAGNTPTNAPTAPADISGLQWQERGPNNIGGRTRALIFDKADSLNGYKRVIAGGVGGGLWITSDITATTVQWTKVNDFFDNIAISCIAQNPVNPKEIYAGTGEGFLNADAIQGLGVWKSSDGGATWAQLPGTEGFKLINAILVDRNGSVYVAGETDNFVGFGVDQSTDGGSTWTNVINSSEAGADLQLAANGDVYASTGVISLTGHIYISDFAVNGANTGNSGKWTNITPETTGVITPTTTSWNRIKLATAPSDPNIVYAFFEPDYYSHSGSTTLSSVQQYNKSANTWTVKTVPSEAFGNGQSWYSIAAAVDPNDPSTLYSGSLDGEKSTDGGSTWTQVSQWDADITASVYVHADHHPYVFAPGSSSRLLIGCDGGIFYTVNATSATPSFVNKNNGYNVTQFYSVALHPTNLNYALAGAQDNGSEKLQGAGIGSSTTATGGDGADVFIDQTNGNIQITSYVYDNYYLSTDNGVTFNGLGAYQNGQFINPTDYDPSTKSLYAGSASGYYYRAENVLSPTYNEVYVSNFAGANVTSVAVAPITPNRVYFGLDNGSVVMVDNAQTGTSLTGVVLLSALGSNYTLSCINVDPTNENHILITYSNYGVAHVAETTNASAATPTWADVSGNLPDMPVRWSIFYPGDPTKALIATELGVWTTNLINGSSTVWDPTNTGLANVSVDMLKYRAADQTVAAATHGRGVFTCNLNSVGLSNLTTSIGTLSPAFAAGTLSYTESVAYTSSSMTVTPTAASGTSTITVNGITVASGSASAPITLLVGSNTITVVVTSASSTTQTYTITVTRAASTNATLSNIVLNNGTLTPAFASAVTSYTATVPYLTTSITLKPVAGNASATIKVNGTTVASNTASGPIALSVGSNTITTVVTAPDHVTTDTYTVTVTRSPQSSVATLANIVPNKGTLNPAFASGTTSYSIMETNSTSSIGITPTTTDATATVTVNGTAVKSGMSSAAIPLTVGSNTITIVVTAQDGTTTDTYTLTVIRPSTNAKLASLTINAGTLTPVFNTNTTSYTVSEPYPQSSVKLTPTVAVAGATITVNGTAVASGATTGFIVLKVGANTITTVVTAQDGVTTDTYTITVTRAAASTNDNLSNIVLNKGTLAPSFASGTTNYSVMETNGTTSVTLTPTTSDATATVTVNGTTVVSGHPSGAITLAVGTNAIPVVVTAQDGTTQQTYTVNVIRPSTNAKLASLTINAGTLSPAFIGTTNSYTANELYAQSSVKLTPTAAAAGATITINGTAVASGATSGFLVLKVGANTINVVVTAQDGVTTDTYTLTVTRAAASTNSNLSALAISKGTLTPTFASSTITYSATETNGTASVTLTPTTQVTTSTVTVNGVAVVSGHASGAITLAVGTNAIPVVVTAQDGTTKKTYTVNVIRPSTNAKLSALSISSGTLTPAFTTNTTAYTDAVTNATGSVTVTPTVAAAGATITVNGTAVASGTASTAQALVVGSNKVTIIVTAQDGVTTDTYSLNVTRAAGGDNIPDAAVSVDAPAEKPQFEDDVLIVHQGLSPNGDGVNDYLVIDGLLAYPDNKLTIMNRNGSVIFESKGYDNANKVFDGHSNKNGQMQLPGTYFYALDYTVKGVTRHKTGFLVLKY